MGDKGSLFDLPFIVFRIKVFLHLKPLFRRKAMPSQIGTKTYVYYYVHKMSAAISTAEPVNWGQLFVLRVLSTPALALRFWAHNTDF